MLKTNNKAVRTFYRFRYTAIGTVLLAYLIYVSYPTLNFGLVLLATAVAVAVVVTVVTRVQRSRRPPGTP